MRQNKANSKKSNSLIYVLLILMAIFVLLGFIFVDVFLYYVLPYFENKNNYNYNNSGKNSSSITSLENFENILIEMKENKIKPLVGSSFWTQQYVEAGKSQKNNGDIEYRKILTITGLGNDGSIMVDFVDGQKYQMKLDEEFDLYIPYYDEFGKAQGIRKVPNSTKNKVLSYLNSGTILAVRYLKTKVSVENKFFRPSEIVVGSI